MVLYMEGLEVSCAAIDGITACCKCALTSFAGPQRSAAQRTNRPAAPCRRLRRLQRLCAFRPPPVVAGLEHRAHKGVGQPGGGAVHVQEAARRGDQGAEDAAAAGSGATRWCQLFGMGAMSEAATPRPLLQDALALAVAKDATAENESAQIAATDRKENGS